MLASVLFSLGVLVAVGTATYTSLLKGTSPWGCEESDTMGN